MSRILLFNTGPAIALKAFGTETLEMDMFSRLLIAAVFLMAAGVPSSVVDAAQSAAKKQPSDVSILKFLCGPEWPNTLSNKRALLAEVLSAGPLKDSSQYGAAMRNLAAIVDSDSLAATDIQRRRTAVAVAMEFANPYINRGSSEATERYQWYRDAQSEGRLHQSFDDLQTWERRFVVNLPWHHGDGANDQLDWLNSEVKLPPADYADACWQAPYRGFNAFGVTVQGPEYYTAFQSDLQPYEMRREVGGVCGGLSHYGAAAARANGIGATTMGEPGHCSYAIRVDGKWTPCYSLSPKRRAHQSLLDSPWPYVLLQDEAFANPEKTLAAARLAGWAIMLAQNAPRDAAKLMIQACDEQPLNPALWQWRLKLLQQGGLNDEAGWLRQAESLGDALAGYPSVVAQTLESLDRKQGVMADSEHRVRMMAGALKGAMGSEASKSPTKDWKAFFEVVYSFGSDEPKQQAALCRALATSVINGPDADHFIEDALVRFEGQADMQQMLVNATANSLREGSKRDDDAMGRLAEIGMASAAKRRDCEAFQTFAGLHPTPRIEGLPAYRRPRGLQWLSEKGSIRFSSTSRYDQLSGHAAVLGAAGGYFHTDTGDNEWAEVTLPKISQIAGIVINNSPTNQSRATPMTIQVSIDGESWQDVQRIENGGPQWEVDLSASAPTARFIRINGAVGRSECFHLRRILVFGQPRS